LFEKILSGNKHIRLNITIYKKDKNKPNKGYIISFSLLKIIHYFPNFRNYFDIEYKEIWNMDNIFLDIMYIKKKIIYPEKYIGDFFLKSNNISKIIFKTILLKFKI
jgi:hypothetical protein